MGNYSNKKIDHKKYIEGQIDLLGGIVIPLLTFLNALSINYGIKLLI